MIKEKNILKRVIKNSKKETISDDSLRKAADKSEKLVKDLDKKRIKRNYTEWA